MAIGDEAKAAGYLLVPSTGEEGRVRWGWREINRTRDYVAQVMSWANWKVTGLENRTKTLETNAYNTVRTEGGIIVHNYGGGLGPVSSTVRFAKPFRTPPNVVCSVQSTQGAEIVAYVSTDPTTTMFQLSSKGVADNIPAHPYGYGIIWLAFGT